MKRADELLKVLVDSQCRVGSPSSCARALADLGEILKLREWQACEFILAAIRIHADTFEWVSDELKADKDVVLAAVRLKGILLYDAAVAVRADRNAVPLAMESIPVDARMTLPIPLLSLLCQE